MKSEVKKAAREEAEELMEKAVVVFDQKAKIISMGYSSLFFDSLYVSAKGKSSGELKNFALIKGMPDKPNEFIIEVFTADMMEPVKAALGLHGVVEKFGNRAVKLTLPLGFVKKDAFQKILLEKREDYKKQVRSLRDDLRKIYCSSKKKSDQELRDEKEIDAVTNNINKKLDDIYSAAFKKLDRL